MCKLALQAVRTVSQEDAGVKTVDLKRYARVEKVPGGEIEQSTVLSGVMLNKDVTHPKMRRRIEKPRIILLDCPLEYKKGESQTNIEISKEADWNRVLEIEEEQVKAMCEKLIEFKPDLVFTEKGVSGMCTNRRYEEDVVYQRATPYRSCATLPSQGQHHGTSSGAQVRQQPDRSCSWSNDCEPYRGPSRCRRRHEMWALQYREDRRRVSAFHFCMPPSLLTRFVSQVLHIPNRMHLTQGLHHPPPRTFERHPQRDRPKPCRRHGRRSQCRLQPKTRAWRRSDGDGDRSGPACEGSKYHWSGRVAVPRRRRRYGGHSTDSRSKCRRERHSGLNGAEGTLMHAVS